ncbi:hypothetical protein BSR29_05815 [Boudabousia liubingyangii]|uniref:HTH gntR-type domain-containing protein n=1 Tax=Boudabousia liubingyangii TaxID=1921764 RepID=A0A1Q5PLR0_9ACTO|nr:GntR family transcriptional regulator [Boudabousia liubingyangii]OKL47994.1 hypothetical protein BSR29_05815 [Boudabousia liubingyangii]
MILELDEYSEVPIFQQIHDQIVFGIARGELPPGTALASVRSLAMDLAINPATVKKAYDLLKAEGVIVTTRRDGSMVIEPGEPTPEQVAQLEGDLKVSLARALAQGMDPQATKEIFQNVLNQFRPAN